VSNYLRIIFLIALSVSILSSCGGGSGDYLDDDDNEGSNGNGDVGDGTRAKWTYMVYLGADNNLSTAGLGDLNEMEMVGSSQDLNIIVQAEYSNEFTNFSEIGFGNYAGETLRYRVIADGNPDLPNATAGTSIGNVDMGSPETLASFIRWGAENYPADHYALVIWDHGAGWKLANVLTKGAVQDTTSNSFMSLPDLARAINDSGVHLDLVNFDACLMGMYEVAYEFSGLTDYMVFSEETEPGDGDPYDTILADLKANPQMSGADLSNVIINRYVESYQGLVAEYPETKITKSAVDMSQIANLHTQIVGLADSIITNYATESSVIETARQSSQNFEYNTNLDLYDFASRLQQGSMNQDIQLSAQSVMSAVSSSVIANKTLNSSVANSYGLAIYLPGSNQISADEVVNSLRDYATLAVNTDRASNWLSVVETTVQQSETTTLVAGGFGFHIAWNTDADVDMYVCEPSNQCYAPWNGQTTPNGYFSGDSIATGYTEEYFMANDYVESGPYTIFIYYYGDGQQFSYADVTFSILDPVSGISEWQSHGPVNLDLSNPGDYNSIPTYEELNNYSNFWYPISVQRATAQEGTVTINTGSREIRFVINREKKVRHEAKE
jgi:hypothetical protein